MSNFTALDFEINYGVISGITETGKQKLKYSGGVIDSFPAEATVIGSGVFSGTNVTVTAINSWGEITSIGNSAFWCNKIVALPDNWGKVTVIGYNAFYGNNIVSIPHNWELVKTIGDGAFSFNSIVSLPESCDNLEVVGDYAFAGNKISKMVSFESVESVGTMPLFDNQF